MTGIRVHIPTTEGPSEIQRITPEDPDVRSVVCLDGKAVAMPISADYDAFVRAPTGVVEAGFGHPAFRLDMSHEITQGLSWQLGVYTAHALHAAGRLAMREEASHRAIWLTGEVDCALDIRPVEQVERKLRQSGRLFSELAAAGIPLTIYLPRENHAGLNDDLFGECGIDGTMCRVVAVDDVTEILADLKLPAARRPGIPSGPRKTKYRRPARAWLAAAPLAVLIPGAVLIGAPGDFSPTRPTAPISVVSMQSRAPDSASCAAVHFGAAKPMVTTAAVSADGKTAALKTSGLCDFRYRIVNRGKSPLRIFAVGARRDADAPTIRTRVFLNDTVLDPGARLELDARPPSTLRSRLSQSTLIAAVPDHASGLRGRFRAGAESIGRRIGPKDWERWRNRVATDAGAATISATQKFRP